MSSGGRFRGYEAEAIGPQSQADAGYQLKYASLVGSIGAAAAGQRGLNNCFVNRHGSSYLVFCVPGRAADRAARFTEDALRDAALMRRKRRAYRPPQRIRSAVEARSASPSALRARHSGQPFQWSGHTLAVANLMPQPETLGEEGRRRGCIPLAKLKRAQEG
jgi:hypothetical protein